MVTSRFKAGLAGSLAALALFATGTSAAAAAPVAELTPPSHAFGQQNVGTESDRFDFTLANVGDGQITVTSVEKAGNNPGQFKIKPATTCATAVVLDSVSPDCRIRVTFDPGSLGTKTALISVVTDLSPTPLTVEITGTSIVVPSVGIGVSSIAIPFETRGVEEGPSVPRTLVISNTGTLPLNVADITTSGDVSQFLIQGMACSDRTLNQNEFCEFPILFKPDSPGAKRAQISIASNAANSPTVVSLVGTATSPPVPTGSARVSLGSKLPRAVRGGKIKVPITCITTGMERCVGKIVATATGEALPIPKGGRFMAARGSFSVKPGRHTVTLRLEPRAVRSLRRQSKFRASFVSTTKQASGKLLKGTGSRFIKAPRRR